jgi:Hypervirulence associated proteins TUDOR domain
MTYITKPALDRSKEKESGSMSKTYKRGDHVAWNSEAGRVTGVIVRKVVSDVRAKGYFHHASTKEPRFFIKSDKTDHIAIHKAQALRLIKPRPRKKAEELREHRKRVP